ncbi:MAG: hypothetical protein KatS3mg028_0823 [Bacteroidia bacterium]|nr:MAG: hypothetical protein KatS3mg028_0823 [Bacteroidia bacterium]
MKTLAIIGIIGLSAIYTLKAQESVVPNTDPNAPEIKFETEVIDYGVIPYDSDGVREFKFKNVGKSPLTITNVQGECGCTATTIDGKPRMAARAGITRQNRKYQGKIRYQKSGAL